MHRWTSILGALLLVLMLWTGSPTHAAEQFGCIPATSEAANHYEGDRDQLPDREQGAAHHHSGCNGHHVAAPANAAAADVVLTLVLVPFAWREAGRPGPGPDGQLRPPIA